jgi:uncharacterized membrane protein
MNVAHLHLLLNHVPTIGTIVALGLFLIAFVRNNDHLKRASLEVFFVVALLTLPTYLSGVAAQAAILHSPGVSEKLMSTHHDAAVLAFLFMEITGFFAWLGLWQFRRNSSSVRRTLLVVLAVSTVTVALMAQTAYIGGEIRHPEIWSGQETTIAEGTVGLSAASIASFVISRTWVWPASETVHFIGLCLLFGIVLLVNLRMLGMMKSVPFAAFHRLLPWAALGFVINSVTGMLFFIAAPNQYTQNVAFHLKIVFMLLAGANLLYLTAFDAPWAMGPGEDAPLTAKAIAASSVFLWVGIIYFGRMLPFIGNAF